MEEHDGTEDHSTPAAAGVDDHQLARLVRDLADAVVIADAAGMITFWNSGAEAIFGWSAAEAVGGSLDLIIPERLQKRHWDGYVRVGDRAYGLRQPAAGGSGNPP